MGIEQTIYHYTNDAGLYGILGNKDEQCVWATHFKFLNDQKEILLFKEELDRFLIPKVEDILRSSDDDQLILNCKRELNGVLTLAEDWVSLAIESIWSALFEQLQTEIYIVSFCSAGNDSYVKNNGLLSQWRGYGINGGYAIEFDTNQLNIALRQESNTYSLRESLDWCVYSDEDQKVKANFAIDLAFLTDFVIEIGRDNNTNFECEIVEKAINSFLKCGSRFKHKAFKEEKEVKIAVALMDNLGEEGKLKKERKFRQRNGVFVPYIDLLENAEKFPIKKIIVGPHKEKEYRAEALRVFLNNKGLNDIDVTVSDIPFV